jgi:hypothetical protein
MDFPLLRTFNVDDSIVDFLNRKYEQLFFEGKIIQTKDSIYVTETGFNSSNLCFYEDIEYKHFLNNHLLQICSNELKIDSKKISINYTHYFDYNKGGYVKLHNHINSEDFVLFFYLNTCSGGNTVFYLNHLPQYSHRTKVKINPIRGHCAIFSSMLFHEAEFTDEAKRIFVVGIQVNLKN